MHRQTVRWMVLSSLILGTWLGSTRANARTPSEVSVREITSGWPVALTFDDGPNPKLTPQILTILERQHVQATFFVVGMNAQAYPFLLRRMVRDGDAIGNHTWNHPWMTRLNAEDQEKQIQSTLDAIHRAVPDYKVTLFRAPYGMANDEIKARVWAHGLTFVWWSADDEDYRGLSPAKLQHFVLTETQPGAVVLMHDIHANTVAALEDEIVALKAKGARFLTVPQLIAEGSTARAQFPRSRPRVLESAPAEPPATPTTHDASETLPTPPVDSAQTNQNG